MAGFIEHANDLEPALPTRLLEHACVFRGIVSTDFTAS